MLKANITQKKYSAALQRWKLLARVIKRDSSALLGGNAGCSGETSTCPTEKEDFSAISVRRFPGFQLFQTKKKMMSGEDEDIQGQGYEWFEFRSNVAEQFSAAQNAVLIRQRTRNVMLQDLGGFDNTGNICIWPAEEVLAYHVMKNAQMFSGQAVCELGAGMAALAGLMLAVSSEATEVYLTDGNEDAVANINCIISKNEKLFGKTKVSERRLIWGVGTSNEGLEGKFDCLICADCFVFVKCHESLLHTMNVLLKPEGHVIAVAPSRNNSLQQFCDGAQRFFHVEIHNSYDDLIWRKHKEARSRGESFYAEDIHYPLLVTLRKR